MIRKYQYSIIILFAIFTSLPLMAKKVDYPQWALQSLTDDTYYYGVGMAHKQKKSTAHVVEAEKLALQKLSENISFSLQSSSILAQLSTDKQTKDELSAIIQVRTSNDVQGYEKLEVFETKKEYWVLFRLSKALYTENERAKHQKAINSAARQIESARAAEANNDIRLAIVSYAHALDQLKAYFNTSNHTFIEGTRIDIVPYSYNKLKKIIQGIKLEAGSPYYSAVQGKTLDSIACKTFYKESPISNIFIKSQLLETDLANIITASNLDGISYFNYPKISSSSTNNTVEFTLDLSSLFEVNNVDYIIRRWLSQIYSDKAETIIKISKANVYISTVEKNNGRLLVNTILKPHFHETVSALGYNIVNNEKDADYIINILTDTRSIYELDKIYYTSLSINIEIKDANGSQIFSNAMPETRGVNTSLARAGLNAYHQSIPLVKNRYFHVIKDALLY